MSSLGAPNRASWAHVGPWLALYLTTLSASLVVQMTPNGDPTWAVTIAVTGCLLIPGGSLFGHARARLRGQSIAQRADATTAGMAGTSFSCALLLCMAVRNHHPFLMLACLAAAALIGFGPAALSRAGEHRAASR